jgi:3-oxoacyl-[acyl-carrier-protein] synthase-3
MNAYHAKISGTGCYLPKQVVNNFDLEKKIETSDEWIRTRTGMFERHFAADDEAASDLATNAGRIAIERAGLKPRDIDMIICATISGDHAFPSKASAIANPIPRAAPVTTTFFPFKPVITPLLLPKQFQYLLIYQY